ncbi:lactate utilization protein C [Bacillus sp. 31A1R]|uniref:Lactate utilization protein C n=1 Tax=Robertmurraya mangrovi TaxID=3098077 RepID=A0ABU5ITR5_9BACI|nr:lactate utilization protein C [Bacillus sp. 31A1R]MDZ5470524.1 lactate utilization protein C [Bacillus sp. 31A1R]
MTGTIHNRDQFLDVIAGRLGRDRNTAGVERPKWKYTPQNEVLKDATQEELVEVLKEQCTKIHTTFLKTNLNQLSTTIDTVVGQLGGGPIVTWKDNRFKPFGLTTLFDKWKVENVDVHVWDNQTGKDNIHFADKANVGITISDITLAESGTAVLFSNKDRGRTVSFLPSTSIILIPKSSIVPRMTQAARIIRENTNKGEHLASCINFITGPSNSADIEMNLVVGVHGPVKATYIVIEDI